MKTDQFINAIIGWGQPGGKWKPDKLHYSKQYLKEMEKEAHPTEKEIQKELAQVVDPLDSELANGDY